MGTGRLLQSTGVPESVAVCAGAAVFQSTTGVPISAVIAPTEGVGAELVIYMSDLGIFVDQSAEPVVASQAKAGVMRS